MMSVLPQLEQELVGAASRRLADRRLRAVRLAGGGHQAGGLAASGLADGARGDARRPSFLRSHARRLRWLSLSLVGLLTTATIALAADGVILRGGVNPRVGLGAPIAGTVNLLPLRVPDPEGGPPWGMRVFQTTRGDVCVQIGRVEHGQLGSLGLDGAFHDDGGFHPRPAVELPSAFGHGAMGASPLSGWGLNGTCPLRGTVFDGGVLDVDRSAAKLAHPPKLPRDRRDIYYGLLGKDAVSVTYSDGAKPLTKAVVPGVGAYLIVRRAAHAKHESSESGYVSLGTEGDLKPDKPLSVITYRLDGKLCERGSVMPPGEALHLAHPCAFPHWPAKHPKPPLNLHKPLHVRLQIHRHLITGATMSFIAPLAVTSARQNYTIEIPVAGCRQDRSVRQVGVIGSGGHRHILLGTSAPILMMESLDRDVARGATVKRRLPGTDLFKGACGHPTTTTTIEVLYKRVSESDRQVIVGKTRIHEPPGTHAPMHPSRAPACARMRRARSEHRRGSRSREANSLFHEWCEAHAQ